MVDTREAIVLSGALLVLFSIPAASQQVKIQENAEDAFDAVIETNFSTSFRLNISTGKETTTLVESTAKYKLKERPYRKIEKLTTPEGSIRIEKTPNISLTTVETPYGTLKTGFRNGENISKFTGPEEMKDEVLEIEEELLQQLKVKRREASAKKRIVMDEVLPDISVDTGNVTSDSEYINLTNTGKKSVILDGWTVKNSDGTIYTLESSLRPGNSVILYASGIENNLSNSVEDTGLDVDSGGTVKVSNRYGFVVTRTVN